MMTDTDTLEDAEAIHQQHPLFVGYFAHCDEPFMVSGGQFADLEKIDRANVRHFVCSIGYGCYFQTAPDAYVLAGPDDWLRERQLERIDFVCNNIERCPRTYLVTRRGQLAVQPNLHGAIGVILHLTGNNHMVDLATVDTFHRRGVRACHPAMQYHNRWVGGYQGTMVNGEPAVTLTEYGREVIARMNELGIVLDTAHAHDDAAQALIAASTRPVYDSHTGSRDFVPQNARCLADETLRMIAERGGVVGIHFADHMLHSDAWQSGKYRPPNGADTPNFAYNRHVLASTDDPDERMRLRRGVARATYYREHGLEEPVADERRLVSVDHMAAHIEHLVNVCGIEHVALGGDVNGITDHSWPMGMDHVGELANLTAALMRRGWKEAALTKFLSENLRRLFRDCLPDE